MTLVLALGACSEVESNVALGTLERDRVTLSATAAEIIVAQPVAEGTHVEAGTLLVQLDTTLQEALVARAQAEQAQLQANLDKLRNGFRSEDIAAAEAVYRTLGKPGEQGLAALAPLRARLQHR